MELTPEPDERSAATGTAQVATSARTAELAAGWEAAQRRGGGGGVGGWTSARRGADRGRDPDLARQRCGRAGHARRHRSGENRLPELRDKRAELAAAATLRWHFLGQLQTNKAKQVAALADQIDTVDRPRPGRRAGQGDCGFAAHPGRAAAGQPRSVGAGPAPGRLRAGRGAAVADRISATDGLRLRGVMGMAPLGGDATQAFALLAQVAQGVAADHPGATEISAGMSGDFAAAIAAGATHVRLGTAILGVRGRSGNVRVWSARC